MKDNQYYIEKAGDILRANFVDSNTGAMPPATAQEFFVRLIEKSKILQLADVRTMRSYKEQLPAVKFSDWFLKAGTEATALGPSDAMTPTFTQPELDVKLFRGVLQISDEALEDNIMQGRFLDFVKSNLPAVAARDIDKVIVQGDKASGATAVLKKLDGVVKLATSNTLDCVSFGKIQKDILDKIIALLPNEYAEDLSALKFLTAIPAVRAYRNTLSDRATNLGDVSVTDRNPVYYGGIELVPVAAFPVSSSKCSVLLCDPKNIKIGFWRDIRVELGRDQRAGVNYVVCTLRMDVTYQDEAAVAKGYNVYVV